MMLTRHESRITGAEVSYLINAWGKQEEIELEIAKVEEY